MNGEILALMSSLVLVTAFYIQGQAYYRAMVDMQAVQSILIATISSYLAYELHSLDLLLLAFSIVILRAFAITLFLRRGIRRSPWIREGQRGVTSMFALDLTFFSIATLVLYYLVLSRLNLSVEVGNLSTLIFPFALFFQGLFLITSRRSTVAQILGYVEEENALILLGVLLVPIPLLVEASVLLDVLGLVVVSSILTLQKQFHERVEELMG
jgi:hydrogenase-4 component E